MNRAIVFGYGLLSSAIGMAGLVVFMLYLGGWGVPRDINAAPTLSWPAAVAINLALLAMFGVQHSVMARAAFKQRLTRLLPASVERSTYVLLSGVVTAGICLLWQPVAGTVWNIDHPTIRAAIVGLQLAGWALVVLASFMLNHFELFGLQQTWAYVTGKTPEQPAFSTRFGYGLVRHPLQLGIMIGIWATSTMSLTHLLFSLGMTAYILIGLTLEERDLAEQFGDDYREYQRRVRMLLPIPRG